MKQSDKVFKLQGKIQHYAWGGHRFLPGLLSVTNPEDKPFAEYWLGAHDNAPSELVGTEGETRLNKVIGGQPEDRLGAYAAGKFGRLPYLLKILDVKDMLSIQVHPTKRSAELEFAVENTKGTPLDAPDRNYKDDNHKPELMVALSEFWLLHGFKPEEAVRRVLGTVKELNFLQPVFEAEGYAGLYGAVMAMDQTRVNEVLQPLVDRILPHYKEGRLSKGSEDFWAARAALTYNQPGRIDRGIFSIYLFNLLNMHPGEAIFQDAGLPHAYLEGQNVEIMANSDNVLRGGLTPKHVDVPELMKHVRFEATHPQIITGEKDAPGHIAVFKTPAPDFQLSEISLLKGEQATIRARSVEIYILLQGEVKVEESAGDPEGQAATHSFTRRSGEAFIAFDGATLSLTGLDKAVIYRATVPQKG